MSNRSFSAAAAMTAMWLVQPPVAQAAEPNIESGRVASASHNSLQQRIVGTWRLVSFYEENEGGEDTAIFGTDPRGQFIATSAQQFSFQIISADGRRLGANRQVVSVCESSGLQEALVYFGTYALDEARGTLNLHITYCLFRSCDKTRRSASVEFVDDKLVFTSAFWPSPTGSFYSRLVWQREPH